MQPLADELKHTYEDILTLGESNRPMELFDGELVMTAMPTPFHQGIAANLVTFLQSYVRPRSLGKVYASVDVYISAVVVLQPDLCFLSPERSHINDGKKFNGAP